MWTSGLKFVMKFSKKYEVWIRKDSPDFKHVFGVGVGRRESEKIWFKYQSFGRNLLVLIKKKKCSLAHVRSYYGFIFRISQMHSER